MEKDEEILDAAKRELHEELGVRADALRVLGEFTNNRDYKTDTVTILLAETVSREVHPDGREVIEAKWFSPYFLPLQSVSFVARKGLSMWLKKDIEET